MEQCLIIIALALLAMLGVLFWNIRWELNKRLIFSPFLLFCLNDMVMVWPATVYARLEGVSADSYATLVVVGSTLTYAVGYFVVRESQGWSSTPFQFWSQPISGCDEHAHRVAILACAALFIPAGLYLYQGLPPAVSGLQQFLSSGYESGVAESIAYNRLMLTKGHYFGGEYRGQGAIRSLMRIGWPYLIAVSMIIYFHRRRLPWRIISLGLALACFVYVAGDGTRGPFLWSMVGLLVTASYHIRLRIRTCVAFATFLVAALVVLSLAQKLSGAADRGELWRDGVRQLAERVFVGNAVHTVHAIEFVRSGELEMRWGSIHAGDVGASLPFVTSDIPFSYELFLLESPDANVSRTTFANTTYLGILYAEFGLPGCLLGYLFLGGLTAVFTRRMFCQKKTPMRGAFTGIAVLYFGQIGLWGSVYCGVAIVVLLCIDRLYRFCWSQAAQDGQRRPGWGPSGPVRVPTAPADRRIAAGSRPPAGQPVFRQLGGYTGRRPS